jgi:hypothetical protein
MHIFFTLLLVLNVGTAFSIFKRPVNGFTAGQLRVIDEVTQSDSDEDATSPGGEYVVVGDGAPEGGDLRRGQSNAQHGRGRGRSASTADGFGLPESPDGDADPSTVNKQAAAHDVHPPVTGYVAIPYTTSEVLCKDCSFFCGLLCCQPAPCNALCGWDTRCCCCASPKLLGDDDNDVLGQEDML